MSFGAPLPSRYLRLVRGAYWSEAAGPAAHGANLSMRHGIILKQAGRGNLSRPVCVCEMEKRVKSTPYTGIVRWGKSCTAHAFLPVEENYRKALICAFPDGN